MRRSTSRWRCWPALLALLLTVSLAPAALAVEVGETGPTFLLPDQNGQDRGPAELHGEKSAVLIFFRGPW